MCILLSLLMFIGKLLTKGTPEKSPHSEYSDKNRMSTALAHTPELIAHPSGKGLCTHPPSGVRISSGSCPRLSFSQCRLLCVPVLFPLRHPCVQWNLFQWPGLWFGVRVWKQDLKLQRVPLAAHGQNSRSWVRCYWEAWRKNSYTKQ